MAALEEFLLNFDIRLVVAAAAALLGTGLGLVLERSRFCLMSGVRDWLADGVSPKLGMFLIAIVTAVLGSQALFAGFGIDASQSIYASATLPLGGLVVGGLLFGIGAALTRGCVSRLTVLSGTGNLRAVVVLLVVGIVAYATMRGVFYTPRIWLQDGLSVDLSAGTLPGLLEAVGIGSSVAIGLVIAAIVLGGLGIALRHRVTVTQAFWSVLVGLTVVGGWAITGILGADDFDPQPLESLTYTGPVAETVQYAMTFTGSAIDFQIALVLGTIAGAFVSALLARRLSLEGFESPQQMVRYLSGAALMGFGGVTALGCTIGQGITGFSTLSVGAPIVLAAIVGGMALGTLLLARAESRSTQGYVIAPAE
ncbi:MAG: YeeE/YedE family protein [Pseudomonadota bacterium]